MGRIHSAGNGDAPVPHFLLLPFVEQGHMNPMLNLASQLAAIATPQCKVTFVNATQPASEQCCRPSSINGSSHSLHYFMHTQDDDSLGNKLQFVTLSSTPPSDAGSNYFLARKPQLEHVSMNSRHTVFKQKLAALEKLQPLIEKMVVDSEASDHPICCIICDLLLWKWVRKMAENHGVRLAVLIPCNALIFISGYANLIGKGSEIEELLVSKFKLPTKDDDARRLGLFSAGDTPEVSREKVKYFGGLMYDLEKQDGEVEYLVNSFAQLEEPLLPMVKEAGVKMTFIAPCTSDYNITAGNGNLSVGNRRTQLAGSALVQEEECMEWLGRQERRSVLYVSFGSEGVLEEAQMQEIAMGIEKSGCRFLWVVRPDVPEASRPPESFRQRMSRRGLFVGWAPQRAVLQHAAVGAFLTHSGWNSTLEAVCCGVPMLCLPLLGDQPTNANLVHDYWQVGLRLQPQWSAGGTQYMVGRDDVEKGVRALMMDEGAPFSHNASHFQRCAQLAAKQAHLNVISFVHRIMFEASTP